jgi:hypothetical protein
MTDLRVIADRVEIEALRGEFTDGARPLTCDQRNAVTVLGSRR